MTTNEFGPNTPKVELFIERLKVMTAEEIKRIEAWDAARDAAWDAARGEARGEAWIAARGATRSAAAIVVMDLITEEQFTILTEPFAEILTELGIVWKSSEVGE
jgi:hypothetical protein